MEDEEDDLETELAKEEEDIQNDPVRRQHFNYCENSWLVNSHPEIFLNNDGNQVADLNFAPAEGKVPENFLEQKDWDIRSWPALHPDGKFGRDHPRKVKLSAQKYFQQRILNKDDRFAKTAGYVFAATSHVESDRLRSNANLCGFKGRKNTDKGGEVSYEVKDPFTVFDRIKNTPKYWQKVKFDMIAKLENIGPFHWFFTLSCGDMRWSSNFTTVLEELGCTFEYLVDEEGHEQVSVLKKENGKKIKIPWREYLEKEVDESQHEMIRKNVLLATRNFQHRVEMFKKEIIFGNNNPMKIRHLSYRVEFQGRGAGHIHGVLWVDLKEIKLKGVRSDRNLCEAFQKLRYGQTLDEWETEAIEKFTDMFCTCTLCPAVAGEEAVRIAKKVNEHGHSKSCKKAGPQCRFLFPRFPLGRTTFIDITQEFPDTEQLSEADRVSILKKVTGVLVEEENGKMVVSKKVKDIMSKFNKEGETREEYRNNISIRIRMVLEAAGEEKPIEYKDYVKAVLQQPRKGSTVMLIRDIDEIFINNYNPELIAAWDANLDIQPVFDYYATITYVTDYWSKDSTGLTDVLKTGVKQLSKDDDMKKKCHDLANVFISHRQVGEAEAYYKLFPHMNLIYSSVATVYAPTEAKGERRQFLQKQDPDEGKGFRVKDKNGLYLEKPDLISKYERRKLVGNDEDDDTLEHLCYSQFVKMYESGGWKTSKKSNKEEED